MDNSSSADERPPADLEARVVDTLRRRGLLRRRRPLLWVAVGGMAGAALIAIGFALGSQSHASSRTGPQFMLLLYGGDGSGGDRRSEYAAWARSLARDGVAIQGEELEDDGARLVARAEPVRHAPGNEPRGYFVLTATDAAAAMQIARGCPHLHHGGVIEVRKIAGSR